MSSLQAGSHFADLFTMPLNNGAIKASVQFMFAEHICLKEQLLQIVILIETLIQMIKI